MQLHVIPVFDSNERQFQNKKIHIVDVVNEIH